MLDKLLLGFLALVIVGMIGATGYHFKIVSDLEDLNNDKDMVIKEVGTTLNKSYSLLYNCEENASKVYNDGYIDGIGERNETTISKLDDLTTS